MGSLYTEVTLYGSIQAMRYLFLLTSFIFPCALAAQDAKATEVFKVPYRLSDVKHVVVRAKINGKGPFNFVVDTGAPAVYFGNEIAKKLGIEPKEAGFWETFDTVEIEGGIKLNKLKARVEEPFQLVGMNKINAAGIKYHGVLGYTVLSQYQIEYDFTEPHLKFTKLNWTPPAPVALGSLSEGATKNMKSMIGLSSLATAFVPKKSDPILVYRGIVGIEVAEQERTLVITKVIENTPAKLAGLQVRDKLVRVNGKTTESLATLQKVMSTVGVEQEITIELERADGEKKTVKLVTARGF